MIRDLVELAVRAVITRNATKLAMLRRRQLPVLVVANLSLPRLDGFACWPICGAWRAARGPPSS